MTAKSKPTNIIQNCTFTGVNIDENATKTAIELAKVLQVEAEASIKRTETLLQIIKLLSGETEYKIGPLLQMNG